MSNGWNVVLPAAIYEAIPRMSGAAVKVALVLAKFADKAGKCFPSMERLAEDSGLTRRGAQKAISELETAGLIFRHVGGGRQNPNHYAIKTANASSQLSEANNEPQFAESTGNSEPQFAESTEKGEPQFAGRYPRN